MEPLRAGNARPYGFDRAAGGERRGDHWSPVPAAAVVGADALIGPSPPQRKAPLFVEGGFWQKYKPAPEGIPGPDFCLFHVFAITCAFAADIGRPRPGAEDVCLADLLDRKTDGNRDLLQVHPD